MSVLNYRKAVKGAKKLVIRGHKFDTFGGPDCTYAIRIYPPTHKALSFWPTCHKL